jgi:hypothetical protein
MLRNSRIDAAGAHNHVMVRGIERGAVFRDDTAEIISSSAWREWAWLGRPDQAAIIRLQYLCQANNLSL